MSTSVFAALLGVLLTPPGLPLPGPEAPLGPALPGVTSPAPPWGSHGHRIAARAAALGLPPELPLFFRRAVDQLEYLGPEPDRWRRSELPEMDEAFRYDHYIDLERVSPSALAAQHRHEFLILLAREGLERPERDGGFLPFRIVELYQRLVAHFASWRHASGTREQRWIEEWIINDAGILGHYVLDGSQPHHTTIHFNGWAEGEPNPEGYSTDRTLHQRFESDFVDAHARLSDLTPRLRPRPQRFRSVRTAVTEFLLSTHANVEQLYRLERDLGFVSASPAPETRAFVVDRLLAGVEMLRSLWWSAWLDSEALTAEGENQR